MNKEKQIEEMERIASKCITSWLSNETPKSSSDYIAEAFYNADYRKASEVAEEIFAEIEKVVNYALCVDVTDWSAYNELKKKYTESEKDDGR